MTASASDCKLECHGRHPVDKLKPAAGSPTTIRSPLVDYDHNVEMIGSIRLNASNLKPRIGGV